MKINVLTTLKDLDNVVIPKSNAKGEPIPDTELVLADIFTTALLSAPYPPGSERPAEQTVKRYELALAVNKGRKLNELLQPVDPEVEISSDMAVALKADINRLYGPIVSGQVLPMLDGK